ncbi:hypothetical protein [Siccibacter colletis]|uniref:UPF0509 protein KFZ77_10600 n=1 Tax=Siccibacter colletis TaxID=1505757 RepID=A0ABY6J954_9ENTR|nr:hypothetical protein [Siccibacter colletis]UYU30350.1 hypothetical protein KFZ77_10600 [Siccibacter colletis]WNN46910.1 hypothetical protein RIN58_10720 [Siccibacter colletis]
MPIVDTKNLAQRIDTVLDILVAGDYHSAINNLEILKAELIALEQREDSNTQPGAVKAPWEI